MEALKVCTKCKVALPNSSFNLDRGRLRSVCKTCNAARDAAYHAANKDMISAYLTENKDRIAAVRAAYRAANKDRAVAYRTANKDRAVAYRTANNCRIAARNAAYEAANKDRRVAYRSVNKDKTNALEAQQRATLSDQYLRRVIFSSAHIPRDNIPLALIAAKRAHIKTRRLIKDNTK